MADIHLTRDLLRAVTQGEVSFQKVSDIELQHLTALCPHCREELQAFQREQSGGRAGYHRAILLLPALLAVQAPRLEAEERRARQDFERLLALPPEKRAGSVKRARSRFRGAALARLLLEESGRRVHADPGEAYEIAGLARLVLHYSPSTSGEFDLIALATAAMANAMRCRGELRQAEEHFGHVRYVITHHGVTETEVLARVDELEGSLRKDQRRFPHAEELLGRAEMLYRIIGAKVETGRVLLKLGEAYFFLQGDIPRAIETVRTALSRLGAASDSRLYLCGRFNLARYHVGAGEYDRAESLLDADEDLYRKFPEPWTQLRLTWLRAKITAGRGDDVTAERSFLEVRDGFLAQGIGYDAAMVCLEDLTLLYLRQGRTADVKRLAEEMVPIFQSQDVHREALAALLLFQEAARQEELTVRRVREFVRYLQEARSDPSLRFGEGSSNSASAYPSAADG